ncbi:MAG: hypothetical protein ACLU4P_00010 [Ruminococcus sp.]
MGKDLRGRGAWEGNRGSENGLYSARYVWIKLGTRGHKRFKRCRNAGNGLPRVTASSAYHKRYFCSGRDAVVDQLGLNIGSVLERRQVYVTMLCRNYRERNIKRPMTTAYL